MCVSHRPVLICSRSVSPHAVDVGFWHFSDMPRTLTMSVDRGKADLAMDELAFFFAPLVVPFGDKDGI